jgi:hypothetical protein
MTLYCYRDLLDGEAYEYFGCTLYFVWGGGEHQKPVQPSVNIPHLLDTAVSKLVARNHPALVFFRNCIDGGTGQQKCLALAKTAGVKIRRQNALALYKVLKLERELQSIPEDMPFEIDPPYDLYELVQEHFADELETALGLTYIKSDLSECELDNDTPVADGDFLFEIGERRTATFRYWGHWHTSTGRWKPLKLFGDFDLLGLRKLLRSISHAQA